MTSVLRHRTAGLEPYLDRQFTATAAMLETVESIFSDLHDRHETITGYWDEQGEGAVPLTPNRIRDVWMTLLPHVDRKVDDDWGWAVSCSRHMG